MGIDLVCPKPGLLDRDREQNRPNEGLGELFRFTLRQPGQEKDEEVLHIWLQILPGLHNLASARASLYRRENYARRDVLEERFYQLAAIRIVRLARQQEPDDVFDSWKLVVGDNHACTLLEEGSKQAD